MVKEKLSDDVNQIPASVFFDPLIDSLNEGVLFYNEKGELIRYNKKALNTFKLTQAEVLKFALSPLDYFQFYDLQNKKVPLAKLPSSRLKNKECFQNLKILVCLPSKGIEVIASYNGYPQIDEQGNFLGGFIIFSDITELVMAESKFENEHDKYKLVNKELKKYQQQLKGDQQLLQAIIDTIPVMISIYNRTVDSIVLNKAVEKITGWKPADTSKTSIMELAYPDSGYRSEVSDYMASLAPGFKDIIMRTKDGRDIETSWANLEIPDGRCVGVGIDISERKKLELELIQAKEKAEKENLIQYAFIQNISHEVRTPMNSILGYTELLYNRVSDDEEFEFLDAISHNGSQLLRLIDDIIDFSRLDKNELTVTKENISISKIMRLAQQQLLGLEKHYNKNSIKIRIYNPLEGNENFILHTDVYRLQQILTNLMSNALNYTNQGFIEIGYNILSSSKQILFYVKDTGIGIPKENHQIVFERFIRLQDDSKDEIRGTGLGLAICKHLVKLLGGEISLESEPGKGSTFFFTHSYLVLSEEQNSNGNETSASDTDEEAEITAPLLKNFTILIAEDDPFSYNMMEHMLLDTHANILHADTGTKALEIINSNNVDFVFLDIRLPEMNGYKVISNIRQFNTQLPVVAQTANALTEDRIKIKNAGFSAHITKPFTQKALFTVLNRFINSEKRESSSEIFS